MDVTGKKLQPCLLFPIFTRDKQYLPRSPIMPLYILIVGERVKQELSTLLEHLSLPLFLWVHVAQYLVFCVVFCYC